MNRAFVDTERKLAAGEAFQFGKPFFYLVAEIDEALGVVAQQVAGVGKAYRPRAAHKKRLTQAVFQLADGQAYRRLRAVEPFSGTRETAFAGHGQKHLEFAQVHLASLHYKAELSKVE